MEQQREVSVGSSVWTSHKLPPAGGNNIEDMLKHSISDGVIYGSVSLYSPRETEHNNVRRRQSRGKSLAQRNFDLRNVSIGNGQTITPIFSRSRLSRGEMCC